MVKYAPGIDHIKALIWKCKILSISRHQVRVKAKRLKPASRVFNRSLREIDSRKPGASLCILLVVGTESNTNFKDRLPPGIMESCKGEDHPTFQPVTGLGLGSIALFIVGA